MAKEKAVIRTDMSRFRWTLLEMKKNKVAYLMIAPFFILFALFTIVPVVLSFLLSFTNFNLLEWPDFVLLDNYIRLFLDDDVFITAIKNTLMFATVTGPGSYLLSMLLAWFINELRPRIRSIVTLLFYAPSISGNVYLIWTIFFSGDEYGLVNAWGMKLGLLSEPVLWFQDEKYIFVLCCGVALWTSLGTSFLSFIAGLQGIDKAQFEAGAVDGIRNRWQELWYITLPNIKPQLMFGAVMSITQSFGFGGVVTALCGFPSVDYAAHTIVHHLEDYGSQRFEIGYSSTIAVILFVVMIGANTLIKKVLSKVGS